VVYEEWKEEVDVLGDGLLRFAREGSWGPSVCGSRPRIRGCGRRGVHLKGGLRGGGEAEV